MPQADDTEAVLESHLLSFSGLLHLHLPCPSPVAPGGGPGAVCLCAPSGKDACQGKGHLPKSHHLPVPQGPPAPEAGASFPVTSPGAVAGGPSRLQAPPQLPAASGSQVPRRLLPDQSPAEVGSSKLLKLNSFCFSDSLRRV